MTWNRQSWNTQADVDELVDTLVRRFGHIGGYQTTSGGPGVLELQKTSTARLITGLTSGVRLVITTGHNNTTVELREHVKHYLLKVPVAIVVTPIPLLLAFPAYGAYQQYQLLEDIRNELNEYFRAMGRSK